MTNYSLRKLSGEVENLEIQVLLLEEKLSLCHNEMFSCGEDQRIIEDVKARIQGLQEQIIGVNNTLEARRELLLAMKKSREEDRYED